MRVTRDRGKQLETPLAEIASVTVHPSSILRLRDSDEKRQAFDGLVDDLEAIAGDLEKAAR